MAATPEVSLQLLWSPGPWLSLLENWLGVSQLSAAGSE